MSSEYIPRLRRELVAAAARERRPLPQARPLALAAVALAAVVLAVLVIRPEIRTAAPGRDQAVYHLTGGAPAAAVLRERLAAADVDGIGVSVTGDDVTVAAPPGLRATVDQLIVPGRFALYDWENSVAGPHGPAPGDPAVTGGENAGRAATLSLPAAARRAAAQSGIVVRAEGASDRGFVLLDRPALTNADLAGARADRDPQAGQPVVGLRFTAGGAAAFRQVTRTVAQRGAARETNQHIALVMDGRVLSVPYIDFRIAPEGLAGQAGAQISSDLTPRAARLLAAVLSSGPLP